MSGLANPDESGQVMLLCALAVHYFVFNFSAFMWQIGRCVDPTTIIACCELCYLQRKPQLKYGFFMAGVYSISSLSKELIPAKLALLIIFMSPVTRYIIEFRLFV